MGLTQEYGYDFERFWREYPKKVGKGDAYRAFKQLKLSTEDVDELVLHLVKRKKEDVKWIEGRYVPNPATFLRQHRWEDAYQRAKPSQQRDWGGHIATDDENNRKYWQEAAKRGVEVPEQYRHYIEGGQVH